jgi:hypothetical protein
MLTKPTINPAQQPRQSSPCTTQLHKLRDVTDRLPDALASTVAKRMRQAYHLADPLLARPSWKPSPARWTAPTRAPRPACGRAWPRL